MVNPYFLMVLLYAALAILAAFDSSLTSLNLAPWFNGLRWLRVHFVTLGIVTETMFGVLAALVAARSSQPKPKTRWDIWLLLNAGILLLIAGIPLTNAALIITGGTLVFVAAVLLLKQLYDLPGMDSSASVWTGTGRKFYIAGLSFLLLGIFVGTGLWQGWLQWVQMRVPIEVHIHANNWGFMSLVFAGLIVDLYPGFTGRALAWQRSITPIFWMLTLAALLLVLGPWFKNEAFTVPGIVLFIGGTVWLLLNIIKPLVNDRAVWRAPGIWTLVTAYAWILAPVLVAPLILLQVVGFPGAGIEQNAPQALIYGWVLLFGYAVIPYLFTRAFLPGQPAQLGGSWLSLSAVHLGGFFLWSSIFVKDYQAALHGIAYVLWTLSLIPFVLALWRIMRAGVNQVEAEAVLEDNSIIVNPDAA